jgi:hypothetical protein
MGEGKDHRAELPRVVGTDPQGSYPVLSYLLETNVEIREIIGDANAIFLSSIWLYPPPLP